ncbi:hypothetical protein [Streptosporangium sp. NPDC051022]
MASIMLSNRQDGDMRAGEQQRIAALMLWTMLLALDLCEWALLV